jgi:hypothetical protein
MGETLFSKSTESGRVYSWQDNDFISVTTAIKNGIAKPGLVAWAARTVADIAVSMSKDGTEPLSKDVLMSAFDEKRSSASNIGNIVHSIAEKISKGQPIDESEVSEDTSPFVDAFKQFIADWQPEFIESEAFVASRKHGYAGTLDAIVKIDDVIYMLDIKTGKSIYAEVGLQLAAYARADFIGRVGGAEEPLPAIHPSRGLVLHLRPGKYALYPVQMGDEVFDAFLAALDVHNYETYLRHYIVGPKMTRESRESNEGVEIG